MAAAFIVYVKIVFIIIDIDNLSKKWINNQGSGRPA